MSWGYPGYIPQIVTPEYFYVNREGTLSSGGARAIKALVRDVLCVCFVNYVSGCNAHAY
jgi:hypothetical protein